MSIQDYGYGLLVEEPVKASKKKGGCSCKKVALGILIALIVIIVLLVAAFFIAYFIMNSGNHLQFDDIFDSSFTAFSVDSKWQSSNRFNWLDESGSIKLTECEGDNSSTTTTILDFAKDFPNDTLETYLPSPTIEESQASDLLLLAVNPVKIWRHSRRSTYLVYSLHSKTSVQIGHTQSVLYGIWSPTIEVNGNDHIYSIAYVENNNVYTDRIVYNTQTHSLRKEETITLTTDGSDAIINGVNGWLYEEEVIHGATTLWWSPNGRYLAWLRTDESEVQTYNFPWYTPESPYPQDKLVRYTKPGGINPVADLLIHDFEENSTVTADHPTEDEFYITTVSWIDDTNGLAFKWLNRLQNNEHIVVCNPSTGAIKVGYNIVTNDIWIPTTQIYSLKGLNKFVTIYSDGKFPQICKFAKDGPTERNAVTIGGMEVTQVIGYNSETKMLYYQAATTPISRHIYAVDIETSTMTSLTENMDGEWWSASCPDPAVTDCKYMVLTNGGPKVPSHALYSVNGTVLKKIATLSDNKKLRDKLNKLKLPKIEYTTFKDDSGEYDLNAYILRPPKITFKRPVLYTVYGGPGSQQVSKAWYKDMFHMYLATQGYHIICVDGRGTGYRGDSFMKVIYKRMGVFEMLDQVAAGKQVSKHVAMHGKVAIWGWSFGGFMTSMVMSNASKSGVFDAGIAVAPPTDWRYYDSAYTERYMQRPEDNEEGYVETSVIPRAKDIKNDSFFLIHGTADDNVHFMNSAILNDELVASNVRFRTMYYVNRDHSIRVGNSLPHLYRNIIDFLAQRLK